MSLTKKRYIVLDALRGFAILGIIFANFPEFSLWTFAYAASHTAGDRVLQALVTFFVDGKFYTLFSLLFGVGFAIQIDNAGGKLRTFYRRMAVLLVIGLLYTWSAMNGHPLGRVPHSIFYLLSVYPMGLAYASALFLLYLKHEEGRCWKILAAPGRMACTNYLFQSVFGILIFYGIGLGLGAQVSLLETELIALGVYTFQTVFSMLWMKFFRYGPVEWIWRVLSYGKWLEIKAPKPVE